jgi:Rod binding domain-containing protein
MTHAINQHAHQAGPSKAFSRPAPTKHERVVQQTQKWVAQTFYGTLLKQVRQSPFHSEKFEGGRGGEAFGSLYDQHLADHMARGAGKKLVDAIARKIEANKAYGKTPGKKHPTENKASLLRSVHATTSFRA